jgi:hypothetical protein
LGCQSDEFLIYPHQQTPQPVSDSPSKFTRFKEKVETWTKRIKKIDPEDYENNRSDLTLMLESLALAIQVKRDNWNSTELRQGEGSQESQTPATSDKSILV